MDFSQIATILVVAGGFGIITRFLKQPLIVGYIFSGLLLSFTRVAGDVSSLEGLGQIGVALLLFHLGLEMKLSDLPVIGKVALLTGTGQIVFTSIAGFLLATLLSFPFLSAVYIAVALTFSSTIIMVKLLSEKKDLSSLYGRIAVGFLLVQDFVAIIILMFLSGLGTGNRSISDFSLIGMKAIFLFGAVWLLSKKILPSLFSKIVASSTELLFLVSLAWALGLASFVAGPLGFSLEIGGFLAGIALSNLPGHLQISARTKPLRDFFLVIFFLILGAKLLIGSSIFPLLPSALIFSFFVLVGNPIIVLIIMGLLGYKKRTSFFAGLTVAQISEFSLILMAMGEKLGHVESSHVATVVLVGIVTMTLSTYLILGAERIYQLFERQLSIFEKKKTREAAFLDKTGFKDHLVLVGSDRTGTALTPYFVKKLTEFVVVDFNPAVFRRLTADGVSVIFGDVNDPDVFSAANIKEARMVISTIGSLSSNLTLLENVKSLKNRPLCLFTASTKPEAIRLYEAGATYVVVPEIVAGDYIRHLLTTYGTSPAKFNKMGKSHFNRLMYQGS